MPANKLFITPKTKVGELLYYSGGSPMSDILQSSGRLKPGEILELITPFIPAPVIDMLRKKGFKTYSVRRDETVLTYILS